MGPSSTSGVTNFFSTASEGFVATLGSTIAPGAATIPLSTASGLTNGNVFVGIIELGLANEQVFTGTVDTAGVQITGVVWTRGSNVSHVAGVSIVDYVTGTGHNMTTAGILKQHTQTGTHTGITTDTVAATGNISSSAGTINAATVSSLKDTSIALSTYRNEAQQPFVASGGVWTGDALGSTKAASMTALVCYINGQRGSIGAVTARTFTASKDTYVDVLNTAGVFTLVYTEVTNNAASPALAANSVRLAIVITEATNIAAATSINQGSVTAINPTVSSNVLTVCDSLGNLICPQTPVPSLIGYRYVTSNVTVSGTTATATTGLSCPVIVPAGRRVRLTTTTFNLSNSGNNFGNLSVCLASAADANRILLSNNVGTIVGNGVTAVGYHTPATTTPTYIGTAAVGGGTGTISAGSVAPYYIAIELV